MQFLIDTDTDSPASLRSAAALLIDIADRAETPNAISEETQAALDSLLAPPPGPAAPPPPPPPAFASVVGPDDPEVEIDDKGAIKVLATTVALTPAAPPAPTPAPPGPAVVPEYDVLGMPWDNRIHASNRAKKIDGAWKNKRGVSADLITACEAQNKPGNATTVAPAAAAPAPLTVPAAASPAPITDAPPAPTAPTAPPPPPPMVGNAAPVAAAPSAIDFKGLMVKIQKATAEGKLNHDQVSMALGTVGLKPEEMAQLINNAPLIASVNSAIDKCLTG